MGVTLGALGGGHQSSRVVDRYGQGNDRQKTSVASTGLIAGKPAPTVSVSCSDPESSTIPVGAGLPAMRPEQPPQLSMTKISSLMAESKQPISPKIGPIGPFLGIFNLMQKPLWQAPSPQGGPTAWGFVFKSLSAGTVRGYAVWRRCLQQCRNPLTGAVWR